MSAFGREPEEDGADDDDRAENRAREDIEDALALRPLARTVVREVRKMSVGMVQRQLVVIGFGAHHEGCPLSRGIMRRRTGRANYSGEAFR